MTKADKEGQRKAPILRFKGFTDAWEQRKLGEIGKIRSCKRIYRNQTSSKGEIPFYKIGTFGKEADSFISRKLYEEYKERFSFPQVGDILISASGTLGRTVVYNGENAYFQDSNIVWIDNDNHLALNKYLEIYYQRIHWKASEGSTIKRLYNSDIERTIISIPKRDEQARLSKCLKLLNKVITLYERKYRQLQTLKSGLLQNIFNNFNSGNTVRLNQICVLKQWKTISSQKMKKKGYPVFGANGIIGYYDKYNHEKPTICITCRGATSGNILISKPYSYITGNAMCLENLSSDFNIKFLYEYLSYRGLKDVITGSAQPQITSSLLGIVKIPIVPLKKQKSISNVLLSLDSIINNIQMKSSYLKKIKETLLNTMFI